MTKTNLLLPSFTVINISVDLNNCLFLAHISMPKLEKFFLSLELISSTFCLYHTKTYPHHNSSRKYVPTSFHHPSITDKRTDVWSRPSCIYTQIFSHKKCFLTPKKWKNGPQKLPIIGPDPFISQSSPDQRPTAQNWFFILWNLGIRHLFSYLW